MDGAKIKELVKAHTQAEVALDFDAVMATICPKPYYELQPLGYVLSSREAVREYYVRGLRMFEHLEPRKAGSGSFEGGDSTLFVGPQGLVVWDDAYFNAPDGSRQIIKALSLFVIDSESELLKGEHIYLNASGAAMFKAALGDDFLSVPGVSVDR